MQPTKLSRAQGISVQRFKVEGPKGATSFLPAKIARQFLAIFSKP